MEMQYVINNNQVQLYEVFDPLYLGLEHLHEDISVYIKRMRVETKFNNRQIQCISSDFCGFFLCLSFSLYFCGRTSFIIFKQV